MVFLTSTNLKATSLVALVAGGVFYSANNFPEIRQQREHAYVPAEMTPNEINPPILIPQQDLDNVISNAPNQYSHPPEKINLQYKQNIENLVAWTKVNLVYTRTGNIVAEGLLLVYDSSTYFQRDKSPKEYDKLIEYLSKSKNLHAIENEDNAQEYFTNGSFDSINLHVRDRLSQNLHLAASILLMPPRITIDLGTQTYSINYPTYVQYFKTENGKTVKHGKPIIFDSWDYSILQIVAEDVMPQIFKFRSSPESAL